jgi:hypothetical protein
LITYKKAKAETQDNTLEDRDSAIDLINEFSKEIASLKHYTFNVVTSTPNIYVFVPGDTKQTFGKDVLSMDWNNFKELLREQSLTP